MATIKWHDLTAEVWYDDRDPDNKGWYAEYSDDDGVWGDSEKTGEDEMPKRANDHALAEKTALRALKTEAKKRAERVASDYEEIYPPRARYHNPPTSNRKAALPESFKVRKSPAHDGGWEIMENGVTHARYPTHDNIRIVANEMARAIARHDGVYDSDARADLISVLDRNHHSLGDDPSGGVF